MRLLLMVKINNPGIFTLFVNTASNKHYEVFLLPVSVSSSSWIRLGLGSLDQDRLNAYGI